jgi:hypothetical protein
MLHDAADAGRRNIEQTRSATDAAGHHDGPDDLDLAERKHERVL